MDPYFYCHLIKRIDSLSGGPELWCGAENWDVAAMDAPVEASCPACLVERGLSEWGVSE